MQRSTTRPPVEAWVLYLAVVLLSLMQEPGRTTLDTRVELATRPASFLSGAFAFWHPEANFGELQNQAYGYLFPQGAYFLLADLVSVPTWLAQRVWMALVLVVALEGARRVACAAGLGRGGAIVASVAYGLSPRIIGTVGVLSAETLPGAVMPWVVLPVLLVVRGRLSPAHGALLSGAGVVAMGGVNAVEVIGSLPLPLLVVLWAVISGQVARRFLVQWTAAVTVASAWWLLPLFVLGAYSPPFYAYVESAANTTGAIGAAKAVRGGSHWVGYLAVGDQPWWPASFALNYTDHLVVIAALTSALGLVGLVLFPTRLRTPLLLSFLLGFASLTIAYGSWVGSPVALEVRALLDGALQMFRNVHKVDPTVRLPLALGLGNLAVLAAAWLRARGGRAVHAVPVAFAVPAALVLALGQPLLDNHTRTPGWGELPEAWTQAHSYLRDHQEDTRTLVLPGSGFALQEWGWTLDEPLLAWDDVPFVTRSMVPVIPGESIRFLEALDQLIVSGDATPALAGQLARAGIGHVLVRRDLVRAATDSPHPGSISVSMESAGLDPVADFGPEMDGGPQIEIYRVPGAHAGPRIADVDDVLTVNGTPEGTLDLVSSGVVAPGQPTVLAGEPGWDERPEVVTDANQRRERAFGRTTEALSATMMREEPFRTDRSTHGFPAGGAPEVVARYAGIKRIEASSSQAYADILGALVASSGPGSVLDSDPRTRWMSAPFSEPDGQWIDITFERARDLGRVRVHPVVGDPEIIDIRTLTITAGGRSQSVTVNPTGVPAEADFSGVVADRLRVTATKTAGARKGMVAISDVEFGGPEPTRSLVVPGSLAPGGALSLSASAPVSACRRTTGLPNCDPTRVRESDEALGLMREIQVAEDMDVAITGQVVRRLTPEAIGLLLTAEDQVLSTSSSVLSNDPMASARLAHDGDLQTAWRPSPWDLQPSISFAWPKKARLRSIRLKYPPGIDAGFRRVEIVAAGRIQGVVFEGDTARLDFPVRTRQATVTFFPSEGSAGVVVPEIDFPDAGIVRPLDLEAQTGRFCGFGPNIEVDGRRILTSVSGTVRDVLLGRPMEFRACSPGDAVEGRPRVVGLGAGAHEVRTQPSSEFAVTTLIARDAASEPRAATVRSLEPTSWSSTERRLTVGPGGRSVLWLPENFNRGWQASTGDQQLAAVRVDGWQQAWVLPESDEGVEVTLRFGPQRAYVVALAVGLVGGAALVLAALVLLVRRRRPAAWRQLEPATEWTTPARVVLAAASLLILGPVGTFAVAIGMWWRRINPAASLVVGATLVAGSALVDVASLRSVPRLSDALAVAGVGLVVGVAVRRSAVPERGYVRILPNWSSVQGLVAALIVVGVTSWRWVLLQGSFWNQDDYYVVARSIQEPLGFEYLFHDFAGHIVPLKFLAYWMVGNWAPFDWGIVAASIALSHLVAGWLMWAVLTRLLPGRWVRVPLLAVFLLSSSSLMPSLWWSAAMQVWPHVICALVAVLYTIRSAQGAGRRWVNHVVVVLAVLVGVGWWEQPLMIVLLVAATALLLQPGRGWSRLVATMRQWWTLWVPLAVLSVVFLAVHARLSEVEGSWPSSVREGAKIVWALTGRNIVPGLVSGPWHAKLNGGAVVPATWVVVVSCLLVAGLVLVLLRKGGSTARWALAFGLLYVAANAFLVVSSRGGFGQVIGLDPRYPYDVLHVAVLLLALVVAAGFRPSWDVRPRTALLVTGAYLAGTIASVAVLVPHFQNPEDRAYVTALREDLARSDSQVLLDRRVPGEIVLPLLGEEALASYVFSPLPEAPAFSLPTTDLKVISPSGGLVPMRFARGGRVSMFGSRNKACGYKVTPGKAHVIGLTDQVEWPDAAQLSYVADRVLDVEVTTDGRTQEFRAYPGLGSVWIPLSGTPSLNRVKVALKEPDSIEGAASLCVYALDVGVSDQAVD